MILFPPLNNDLSANIIGAARVDLTPYSNTNFYVTPADGYVRLQVRFDAPVNSYVTCYILRNDSLESIFSLLWKETSATTVASKVISTFVKKGMAIRGVVSNSLCSAEYWSIT
jgi:hypothetical protein